MLAQLQALCAGHVTAAQLGAAEAAASFAVPSRPDPMDEGTLATVLPLVASALPEAVGPALLAPLDTLVKRARQVRAGGQRFLCPCSGASFTAQASAAIEQPTHKAHAAVSMLHCGPAQDNNWQVERASSLSAMLECPATSLAAVVAGSSLPRVALELAASLLEGQPDLEVAVKVGERIELVVETAALATCH